jgi:alpha-aminoadipic semialdehyde synthase
MRLRNFRYFSHTIKAQKANMNALDHILENNIRLIDYEKICDSEGKRLVAFGRFAGLAGMIDFLSGLGIFLFQR